MKRLAFLAFLVLALQACSGESEQTPSAGRADLPAGALGQLEFTPEDWQEGATTWWIESEGNEPGIAGCHIGADSDGSPNGRTFGEFCLADGILVETTPGPGGAVLHSHENDIGRPSRIDCAAWCIGNGDLGGMCEVATAAPPCAQSARCVCN